MSILKMSNPKLSNEVLIRSKKTLKTIINKDSFDRYWVYTKIKNKKNTFIPTSLYSTELSCEKKWREGTLYIIPTLFAYLWCAIPTYLYIFISYFWCYFSVSLRRLLLSSVTKILDLKTALTKNLVCNAKKEQ